MRHSFIFIPLFCFTVLFFGCEKKLEKRLLGKWGYSEKGYYVVNSIFTSDTTIILNGADINFKENGTGVLTRDTSSFSFEWAASDEEVTLTYDNQEPKVYTIFLNTSDQQLWGFKDEEKGDENGISYEKKWRSTISIKKFNQ